MHALHLERLGAKSPHLPDLRIVRAPDGTEWEICASRLVPPKWRPGYDVPGLFVGRGGGFVFGEGPLSALYNGMLLPMFRYMFELPAAIAKGRKSKVIWIEAKSYYPAHEAYYWRTSKDHVDAAVEDIARGFAAGETVPRSMRASYHGTSQSWTGEELAPQTI